MHVACSLIYTGVHVVIQNEEVEMYALLVARKRKTYNLDERVANAILKAAQKDNPPTRFATGLKPSKKEPTLALDPIV